MPKKKAPVRKKATKTHCGVSTKVVKEYGICDVACTPHKKKKCDYHKKKVKKK